MYADVKHFCILQEKNVRFLVLENLQATHPCIPLLECCRYGATLWLTGFPHKYKIDVKKCTTWSKYHLFRLIETLLLHKASIEHQRSFSITLFLDITALGYRSLFVSSFCSYLFQCLFHYFRILFLQCVLQRVLIIHQIDSWCIIIG